MSRVILGHHFAFGPPLLNVMDTQYTLEVMNQRGGGFLFEAVMEGEYSVDSFLFIGATLLSFLLLKDLDKSQGWFHSKGLVRMGLFYLNRYLRITIPYILVMAVYIGITPLIVLYKMGGVYPHIIHFLESVRRFSGSPILGSRASDLGFRTSPEVPGHKKA